MASFSRTYKIPNESSKSFFLTWETGFNNVKIYENGALINSVDVGYYLLKGVDIKTETHNNISVSLSKSKPTSILLNVDGDDYFPEKLGGQNGGGLQEFKGISTLFWWIFGLSVLGGVIEIAMLPSFISSAQYALIVGIDAVVVGLFGFTAYMLQKERAWAYFIGGPAYILLSILVILLMFQGTVGLGQVIGLGIRGFFIYYIIKTAPMILRRMKGDEKLDSTDVLDSF